MKIRKAKMKVKKGYWILYPKTDINKKVLVLKNYPRTEKLESIFGKEYGHAEGPYKTKEEVTIRLNWRDITGNMRPKGY